MSVSLCLSVCLSACLLAYLKNEMSKVPNFRPTEILCMSPTAVVRSFFSRVAIRYVLPVFLRICLHVIVQATQAKRLLE